AAGQRDPLRADRSPARPVRVLRRGHGRQGRAQAHILVYEGARRVGELPAPHEPAREPRRAAGRGRRVLPAARPGGFSPAVRGGARGMKQTSEIADCVRRSLERYFKDLDGAKPRAIYDMVMKNVERPMLEIVLDRAAGNQSVAAEMLGINRNTLRK